MQRAAEALYSQEGRKQVQAINDYYLGNARLAVNALSDLGYSCYGGKNSPYIWLDAGMDSWQFFDLMLDKAGVVCTPGAGFGRCGEGFVRISAFNSRDNVEKALDRIRAALPRA